MRALKDAARNPGTGRSVNDIAATIVSRCVEGDAQILKQAWDRIDGAVPQRIEGDVVISIEDDALWEC